jgi:alpha-N-arabinofuranosidase
LGNEAWGCGGSMTVDYYIDKAANYSIFCRNYPGNHLYKIACGGYGWDDNYEWTDKLMNQGRHRIGFKAHAIHYYTSSGQKIHQNSATEFEETGWFDVLQATLKMEDIIKQNIAIMDRYDAEKNTDLIIDEWGTWYQVEPGTNPSFLFQQNSLRDAIVAAVNLNLFNNYCERVFMANIAQTVNVLQAMMLTRDHLMVRTPTFYVYKMFVPHQDATMLPVQIKCNNYEFGNEKIPAISASSSLDANGKIHVSLVNCDPNKTQKIVCTIVGKKVTRVNAQILTAIKMNAFNDFGKPEQVKPEFFQNAKIKNSELIVDMPAKSMVMLELF